MRNSKSVRRPFFGPNAVPFAVQLVLGLTVFHLLVWLGVGDFVYNAVYGFITATPE
tara:strand:- start:1249 stop:1416 length:168 start_codon:yes stop_codon:yes gene_type:complete